MWIKDLILFCKNVRPADTLGVEFELKVSKVMCNFNVHMYVGRSQLKSQVTHKS